MFESLLIKAVQAVLSDNNFNLIAQPSTVLPLLSFEGVRRELESPGLFEGTFKMAYLSKYENKTEFQQHFDQVAEIKDVLNYKMNDLKLKEPTLDIVTFMFQDQETETFEEESGGKLLLVTDLTFKHISTDE